VDVRLRRALTRRRASRRGFALLLRRIEAKRLGRSAAKVKRRILPSRMASTCALRERRETVASGSGTKNPKASLTARVRSRGANEVARAIRTVM